MSALLSLPCFKPLTEVVDRELGLALRSLVEDLAELQEAVHVDLDGEVVVGDGLLGLEETLGNNTTHVGGGDVLVLGSGGGRSTGSGSGGSRGDLEALNVGLGDETVGTSALDLGKGDTLGKSNLAGDGRSEEGGLVGADLGRLGGGGSSLLLGLGGLSLGGSGLGGLGSGGLNTVNSGDGGVGNVGLGSERVGTGKVVTLLAEDGDGVADSDVLRAVGSLGEKSGQQGRQPSKEKIIVGQVEAGETAGGRQ